MPQERRIRTTVVEEHEDGSTTQVEFEELQLSADDPFVRSRQGARDRDGGFSEIVTEFKPAQERPLTYPAGMPFLRNREAWTTESPSGTHSTGARWRCSDPDAVITDVIAISQADGWSQTLVPAALAGAISSDGVVLQRSGRLRVVTKHEFDDVRIVELIELGDDWA